MADGPVIYAGTPPMYDELLALYERCRDAEPRNFTAYYTELERLMWEEATTPEEVVAAALVSTASTLPGGSRLPEFTYPTEFAVYAVVGWPWGEPNTSGKHALRIGGRDPAEARLRLRDAIVESAREQLT